MSDWPEVALSEVFDIARGGSPRPIDDFVTDSPDGVNWITIADASEGSKYITRTKRRIRREGISRSREVKPGDFLLTNSMSFGRPYIMRTSGCIHDGWLMLSSRRSDVDQDFFYHLLGSKRLYSEFERLAAGATVKNLNIDVVKNVKVVLPPLLEQRRIAAILDKADELRAQRRAAVEQLSGLTQATFVEMFGDPVSNERGWEVKTFGELLREPLRNGVSPSTSGRFQLRVLTLTAVTGASFNETASKAATFANEPPPGQRVNEKDFLICRGNGNLNLVGKGYFPLSSMPDVVFPDTIIAGRVERSRLSPICLETLWNSPAVRRQIEALARTTTGTFKVNQSMLEGIRLILPPIAVQETFSNRIDAVRKLLTTNLHHLDTCDTLFDTLQYHAYSGAL